MEMAGLSITTTGLTMYDPWYEAVDDGSIVHVLILDPGNHWRCVECNIDRDHELRDDNGSKLGDVDEFVIVGGTPTDSPVVVMPDPWLEYSEAKGWEGIVEMVSLMPESSVQRFDAWQNRKNLEDVAI